MKLTRRYLLKALAGLPFVGAAIAAALPKKAWDDEKMAPDDLLHFNPKWHEIMERWKELQPTVYGACDDGENQSHYVQDRVGVFRSCPDCGVFRVVMPYRPLRPNT